MLNPIVFTERVVQDFFVTNSRPTRFADKNLYGQMLHLLNLDETRRSPLLKGPYVSLEMPNRFLRLAKWRRVSTVNKWKSRLLNVETQPHNLTKR
jgi:hypothetical protein